MKIIKIKSLKLTNFKGIRSLELKELSQQTFIYGHNGTGKTSVFDAFTWLLFGKDSTDRKDFEVKTLDSQNNVIPKIEHEVEAVLDVDGEIIELRRILREKWVTRRGSVDAEFSGNETVYEWNGVPMNASEYSNKINGIVNEKVFKMITNPSAFNSLKWMDQRAVLIDMCGHVTDEDVAQGNNEFTELLTKLTGKSFDEYKKQIKASVLKSKKELQAIPTRIDEVERSKPEALDFDKLNADLIEKENALKGINEQITDELKAQQALIDQKSKIKTQIQVLDHKSSDIKHEYRTKAKDIFRKQNSSKEVFQREFDEKNAELTSATNALATLKSKLDSKKLELTEISSKIIGLRSEWEKKNAEPISFEIDSCCPTCNQDLPAENLSTKREQMEKRLFDEKQTELNQINARGKSLKELQESTIKERDNLESRIEEGLKHVSNINTALSEIEHSLKSDVSESIKTEEEIYNDILKEDTEINSIQLEVTKLSEQFENIGGVNVDGFKTTRDEINKEIGELKSQLQKQEQITAANKRIDELSQEEQHLAQSIADLEKDMFVLESFEKEKSTRIETSVNSRFNMVNFKLFETQINGGEVPTCKALIDGVPFSDANTASKINAGLDIINTLCMHYKAIAPIFIDNRESVVELIPTESQVINLIVSELDKKLRVVMMEEELETV